MSEPSYNRQQIFAIFKGDTRHEPLIEDETFGLFVEHVTGKVSPFDIEGTLEEYFGVTSMSMIDTRDLVVMYGKFREWRETI